MHAAMLKDAWFKFRVCHLKVYTEIMLERAFENPLNSKEIKPVNPKGTQP